MDLFDNLKNNKKHPTSLKDKNHGKTLVDDFSTDAPELKGLNDNQIYKN